MKLILFDIDGTLIPIGQVKYWDESFRRCCGVKSLKRSDMKGKNVQIKWD